MNGNISSLLPEEGEWKSRFYRTDVSLDYNMISGLFHFL